MKFCSRPSPWPRWTACLLLAACIPAGTVLSDEGRPAALNLALVGGRIHTQSPAGVVESSLLIRDGKIAVLGQFDLPDGVRRIDVAGMIVTPGWIDARSSLWLNPTTALEGASDGGLNAVDGMDPFSDDWRDVIRQGVTAVYVQPAATGVFGGRGAVLRVAPGRSPDELLIQADAGAQASLGVAGQPPTSRERHAHFEQVRTALLAARQYDEAWKKHEAAAAAPESAGKEAAKPAEKPKPAEKSKPEAPSEASSSKANPPAPPPRDPTRDFLRKVLNRQIPLRIEAHTDDCLAKALQLADEFSIRIVIEGASRPLTSLPAIRSRRVPLVLGPVAELATAPAYRARRHELWLTQLVQDDARWALATFGEHPRASRLLRVHAAAAVAQGIPPDHVLRAVTHHAAAILGVDDRLGMISLGRPADLAVFAGDPLDPSIPVRLVVSNGQIVYESPQPLVASLPTPRAEATLETRLPATYAIRTSRCWTESGRLEPRLVVIANGRVAAVHPITASSPPTLPDVPVYDVGAAVVTPGLVLAHSEAGIAANVDEPVDADASYLRAVDALDPSHHRLRQAARGGFLSVVFAPGSSNVLAGSAGLVRPAAAEPIQAAYLAGKLVLTSEARNIERYPASLAGQFELIDRAFSGKPVERNLFTPPRIHEQLERERRRQLDALLSRERVALFAARTDAEIEAALKLIERFRLRAVLVEAERIEPFIPDLQRLNVGLIARPIRPQDHDRSIEELARASRAGVPVAFGLGNPERIRSTVALAVQAGMARETALAALTHGAAQLLGLTSGTGRLEPQQPADLVVWNGTPLDPGSRVLHVIVDGQLWEREPTRPTETQPTSQQIAQQPAP